ncbi:TPA: hypothetical protein ACWV5V_001470 [Salmonella enterica subsp. enterica serovar Muenchen]|uniref:Uncharacterized protein n=1 Tax=Salmonella enterica subsp. enterica serovar Rough O:d:1,7 TaxID=1974323 RepID=A0A974QGL2_SALET|nr:hypothetical protein [Salmonella enterica]OSD73145.1 hypothetical protein R537_06045 [Salmonella enterica subsp. enterica serovar Rough O:d:1,7]
MKKRLSKAELIEKRNSDLEINKRLRRMYMLSLTMSYSLSKDPAIANHISTCMGELFSYFSDDAHYVWSELNNRKWGGVRDWQENQKEIADNYN